MTIAWTSFPSAVDATSSDVLVGLAGGTTNARFNVSSLLLVAQNLSDVDDAVASFDNISPLTTKGDVIWFDGTHNARFAIGTMGQLMAVGASNTIDWIDNPSLLIASNLSDVDDAVASFDNISPLTTKGDVIWFDGTHNVRQAIGTLNQVLSVGASDTLDWVSDPIFASVTVTGLYNSSVANALTAHAGGGQGSALALTKGINRITTVGTAADSVKLPAAIAGAQVVVINAAAANAMACFPASGEAINALVADTALSIAANKTVMFFCAVNGTWNSIVTA